jgi:endonuclease-3
VPRIPFPTKKVPRKVALEELAILEQTYPHAVTALHYDNDFQLLVSVILSAQTTDVRVNLTTPALFAKYPTPEKLARAKPADVEKIIMSTGFFRMKTKNIIACARDLVERFGGLVPREREQLESLAGVGRKTASVVMAAASHRLGLTVGTTPRQVEEDVTKLVPQNKWGDASHWLILHGRQICKAPTPLCDRCPVNHFCPTPRIIKRLKTRS